jgi:hypothetical protein
VKGFTFAFCGKLTMLAFDFHDVEEKEPEDMVGSCGRVFDIGGMGVKYRGLEYAAVTGRGREWSVDINTWGGDLM